MVILLVILFAIIAGALSYWWYVVYIQRKKLQWMPGELGLPFFGIILEVTDNTEVLNVLEKYTKKHNGLCWVNTLTWPTVLATDRKFVEFFLSSNQILDKGLIYGFLMDWLGRGLLTSSGSYWRKMRKIVTPAFHFSILEQFVPIFESNLETLITILQRESKKGVVDIFPFITMYTLDNICETAMGVKVNAQIDTESQYITAVKQMCSLTVERMKSLTGRYNITHSLSKNYHKQKKANNILHSYTDRVINQRRNELKNDNNENESDDLGCKKKMAFLDLLLKTTLDGQTLPHEMIRDEVNTFMFAGHDTTASSISSVIYCLAKHPEIQRQAVEEQKLIFENDLNRTATCRDLQEMKYLEKIVKETLRLYPPVPFISRACHKDIHYEEGKVIPAGIEVVIFIRGINRNPDIFPNPDSFIPERFEDISNTSPYSNIPFSAGPRNCIGQKFAMLEIKSTVSKLLRKFEICTPGAGYEPIFTSELVFHSKNGIQVVLKERNSGNCRLRKIVS